jgi:hypothetical protein
MHRARAQRLTALSGGSITEADLSQLPSLIILLLTHHLLPPLMPSRPEPLHLFIDPIPSCQPNSSSPDDSGGSSSWSSVVADSVDSSDDGVPVICSVLCQHDFSTSDPDQLPFRKNEILDVVTKEDNGWWAAMRPNGDRIGWIPSAFVTVVPQDTLHRLTSIVEGLRVFDYQAERLYETAPVGQFPALFHSTGKLQSPAEVRLRRLDPLGCTMLTPPFTAYGGLGIQSSACFAH